MRPRNLPLEASSLILLLSSHFCSSFGVERVLFSSTLRSHRPRLLSLPVLWGGRPRRRFAFVNCYQRSATRHSHCLCHCRHRHPHSWLLAATLDRTNSDDGNDGDLLKWERMYYEGANNMQPLTTLSGSDPVEAAPNQSGSVRGFPPPEEKDADAEESDALIRCQIRVVTFDLDNTVWRTDPTIAAANDALAYYLTAECGGMISSDDGVAIPRVENVMKDLFRAHPDRYGPKKVEESGLRRSTGKDEQTATHSFSSVASSPISAPVQLTKLRKDAIREVLKSCSQQSYAASDSDATVDRAFEHWVRVRHDAIGSHLADEAHECLAAISRIRTSEGHPVLIGAITDGNSDPSLVECLEPYFDFCVNAESVGIAKPSAILYLEAASLHVLSHPSLHMIRPRSSRLSDRNATAQEEDSVPVEELIGPWWVHVGDDFIKDVVASKSLKMRSVWCRELVGKTTPRLLSSAFTPQNPPLNQSPRRTVEDLVREVSEMKVVRMEVGSDDYLAESVRREFADAVLDRFADLVPLLRSWHDEGLDHAGVAKETEAALRIESIDLPWTVDRSTDRPPPPESSLHPPGLSAPDTKFCIHCGEKLPAVAKFCSACGQKQI